MPYADLFPAFPDDAHLWVYPATRPLTEHQQSALLTSLQPFLDGWKTHGSPVTAAAAVVADRFLLIAGYLPDGDVSGCGIDASTRAIGDAARAQGIEWGSALDVYYRDESGEVVSASRTSFRGLARSGTISAEVRVFDPSITTVGALSAGTFELPASRSWHGRYFASTAV